MQVRKISTGATLKLPLFRDRVSAGRPSAVEDRVEASLDLNRHLIRHPTATFFVRVSGDSMSGAGISGDDILIVDRAIAAGDGDIVIARIDAELTVKRLHVKGKQLWLEPEHEGSQPIRITEETDFEVWGKVMFVIHQL